MLLSLTDVTPAAEHKAALAKVWFKDGRGGVVDRLVAPARNGLSQVVHLGETLLEKAREILHDPEMLGRVVHEGSEIARELAHALSLPDDPPTRFRGPLGVSKRCAWGEPMPIDEVKIVGKALGCTVNDVLMACATGALRAYLIEKGSDPDGIDIRATVPVNLRPLEHSKELGNHFGLVFLTLPIGEPNPLRRLERIAESMREIKRSRQAIMAFGLLAAIGMAPAVLQGPALEMFSRKATAVATNVPGPQMPLYFAGSRIDDQMFWVPQTGSIGMGISILSYNGRIHFGLMTDAKLVPDPGNVIGRFAAEFEKLVLATLMEDWNESITSDGASITLARYSPGTGTNVRLSAKRVAAVTKSTAIKKKTEAGQTGTAKPQPQPKVAKAKLKVAKGSALANKARARVFDLA
ncbi:MAG: WS/DGAT domain-containing protein [Pseudomonadota bacterium]|nr:WS/DGAT domain-containing protein [Pseudomonadota bacterium]